MKNHLIILFLFIIYSCGSLQVKEPKSQIDKENVLTNKQYELIFEKVKTLPNQAQLSIAIIKNNDVKFYGIKREKDSTFALKNQNNVFEIGSITKVFTGTLLAKYVIDKKIELDNHIDDFLNFSLKDNIKITFKQLATHTSGLPRVPASLDSVSLENPYKEFGEEKLEIYLTEKLKMAQKPRRKM